jgi:beta-galactosidase/beta-glucuronidase
MFSCKLYPFYQKAFIDSSLIEVREQVGRLQSHASIAMWVLNNEGENIV